MEWTDRHCRVFHRTLTRSAVLYTEMVTARAVKHGNRAKLLGFDQREQPVVLQLGGSEPAILAEATKIGEDFGYSAINLIAAAHQTACRAEILALASWLRQNWWRNVSPRCKRV